MHLSEMALTVAMQKQMIVNAIRASLEGTSKGFTT
jgi:hypothetical protein